MVLRSITLSDGEIDLAAAIASREVIPFIGTGFSIEAFQKASLSHTMPRWDEFVDRLVELCGHPPLGSAKQIFGESFPDLLQIVLDNTGTRVPIGKVLEETFLTGVPYTQVAASARLAKTLQRIKPPLVLTTNYDVLLEEIWPSVPVLDLSSDQEKITDLLGGRLPESAMPHAIIKIHGTADNPLEAAVTSTDYRRLFVDNMLVQRLLLTLGKYYSFWFIGYSLRDIDVRVALYELQKRYLQRQHFRHEMRLSHPLQPRVEHIQQNVRLLELHPEELSDRVHRIRSVARTLSGEIRKFSIFSSTEQSFAYLTRILSRFEVPWSERLAQSLLVDWLGELQAETADWTAPLGSYDRWDRFFMAESILRHHLFIQSKFDERVLVSRYTLNVMNEIPQRFALSAIGAVAEGLCYIVPDKDILERTRRKLQRIERRVKVGNEKQVALASALIHRSSAKLEVDRDKKITPLQEAVKAAAFADDSEYQCACLLDLSMLRVYDLLDRNLADLSQMERVDGVVTARAALELALYGGSYRRADLALQRLAILDIPDAKGQWLRAAAELRREGRLPKEARNKLYFDLARGLVCAQMGDYGKALNLVGRYSADWIKANGLKYSDVNFYTRVESAVTSKLAMSP